MKKNRVAIKRLILLIWAASVFSGENIISQTRSWQTVYFNNGPSPKSAGEQCLPGDFNGDGRTDIACYTLNNGEWYLGFAPKSGVQWESQRWYYGPSPTSIKNQCLAGDFNGDGRTDIACYTLNGGDWLLGLAPKNGAQWENQHWNYGPSPKSVRGQCFAGDFNGDGRTDIACYTFNGGEWYLALAPQSGDQWQNARWFNGPEPGRAGEQCRSGDFNGDGRTDIACYTLNGREWHVGLSPKTGTQWKNQRWEIAMPISPLIGDFNGDHLDDMVTRLAFLGGSGRWQFAFSAEQGNKWNMKSEVINLQPKSIDDQCFIGDFNGDGYDDIICFTLEGGKWGIAFYK